MCRRQHPHTSMFINAFYLDTDQKTLLNSHLGFLRGASRKLYGGEPMARFVRDAPLILLLAPIASAEVLSGPWGPEAATRTADLVALGTGEIRIDFVPTRGAGADICGASAEVVERQWVAQGSFFGFVDLSELPHRRGAVPPNEWLADSRSQHRAPLARAEVPNGWGLALSGSALPV